MDKDKQKERKIALVCFFATVLIAFGSGKHVFKKTETKSTTVEVLEKFERTHGKGQSELLLIVKVIDTGKILDINVSPSTYVLKNKGDIIVFKLSNMDLGIEEGFWKQCLDIVLFMTFIFSIFALIAFLPYFVYLLN